MTGKVTRLPTAAKRRIRSPQLTGIQLADRGIARILPKAEPAIVVPPFDPSNPAHVAAWRSMYEFGLLNRRLEDERGI